jgi:translation initiation factor 3 subunit G
VTSLGDDVVVVLKKKTAQAQSAQKKEEIFAMNIVCRKCGKVGDHWTSKCPFKDRQDLPAAEQSTSSAAAAADTAATTTLGGGAGRYVPPTIRNLKPGERASMSSSGGSGRDGGRDESNTIRVSNLSDETKEADLRELFQPFGQLQRVFLAKNKNSGTSRGFAYVTFYRRDDGQRAIDKLNGFGYDHLILKLEWAAARD